MTGREFDKNYEVPFKYRMVLKFDGFERVVEGEYPARVPPIAATGETHRCPQCGAHVWPSAPSATLPPDYHQLEALIVEVVRRCGVRAGVRPEVYGAMCAGIREVIGLASAPTDDRCAVCGSPKGYPCGEEDQTNCPRTQYVHDERQP